MRHAPMNKSVPSSGKQPREITAFTVLTTTCAYNRISQLCDLLEQRSDQSSCRVLRQHCKMRTDGILAK